MAVYDVQHIKYSQTEKNGAARILVAENAKC